MASLLTLLIIYSFMKNIFSFTTPEIFPKPLLNYIPCEAQNHDRLDFLEERYHQDYSNNTLRSQRLRRSVHLNFPTAAGAPSRLISNFFINLPMPHPGTVFMPLTLQGAWSTLLPNFTFGFWESGKSLSDRFTLFKLTEDLLDHFGADGHSCVLRAICERSEYHILVDGLIAEIFTLLLEIGDINKNGLYSSYENAQNYGRTNGDCHKQYSTCPFSAFNWFN